MHPHDQAQRTRFVTETDFNFSVIASAGSGKTRGISDRIVAIARRPDAESVLPTLKVVTFTQKAADELHHRARQGIRASGVPRAAARAFERCFFGTLHSYAATLLRNHGHHLGLSTAFEVLQDDSHLWRSFLCAHIGFPDGMDAATFRQLVRALPYADLLPLVRAYDFTRCPPTPTGPAPDIDLGPVLNFPLPKRKDTAGNVEASKKALSAWAAAWAEGDTFCPLPMPDTGGKEYIAAACAALAPLRTWIGCAAAEAIYHLAVNYRAFRIRAGRLTFNDLVALAVDLAVHPECGPILKRENHRIILDEAQDTDVHQFHLLLEVTRPAHSACEPFLESRLNPPRPGHFCMVGDPQQAIYGSRADLSTYLNVHAALLSAGATESLQFAVTFRCDRKVVEFANSCFPSILSGKDGQVEFVPLVARPAADDGVVLRVQVGGAETGDGKLSDLISARATARFLSTRGPGAFGANDWNEVALLCPRKDWFGVLREAFSEVGLRLSFQSTNEVYGDVPVWAWAAALCTVWSTPSNHVETFGILREVFGISDHDVAMHCAGDPTRLELSSRWVGSDSSVGASLGQMTEAMALFRTLPLRSALARALEAIKFEARLQSLPDAVRATLAMDLNALFMRASKAEAEGRGLSSFAAELRELLKTNIQPAAIGSDALPVITNLKSKGLQWSCVVIPFFGRPISYRNETYPRFLPSNCPVPIALDRESIPGKWAETARRKRTQEAERVLYVSLTRSKRSLVLMDDCALWSDEADTVAPASLAKALRVDAENRQLFRELPSECPAFLKTASSPNAPTQTQLLPALTEIDEAAVITTASAFPRRVAPYPPALLSKEGTEEGSGDIRTAMGIEGDAGALSYSSWWRNLMESVPWTKQATAWDAHFASTVASSPDVMRSHKEWAIFRASALCAMLTKEGRLFYPEMPFCLPLVGGGCLEGSIDLAVRLVAGPWIVVVWTTVDSPGAELVAQLGPLASTYSQVVEAAGGGSARCFIYATTKGELGECGAFAQAA